MRIDYFDNETLTTGFIMPKFTDCIKVIWYCDAETFYCFILLIFYLLGCFQVRFYQYDEVNSNNFLMSWETIRFVSFNSIDWNPISILADFILQIMNCFYAKSLIGIKVSPRIIIDVKDNRAYIIHIKK